MLVQHRRIVAPIETSDFYRRYHYMQAPCSISRTSLDRFGIWFQVLMICVKLFVKRTSLLIFFFLTTLLTFVEIQKHLFSRKQLAEHLSFSRCRSFATLRACIRETCTRVLFFFFSLSLPQRIRYRFAMFGSVKRSTMTPRFDSSWWRGIPRRRKRYRLPLFINLPLYRYSLAIETELFFVRTKLYSMVLPYCLYDGKSTSRVNV